jgi:APA family basic amino acid/polyamine antiporter
MNEVNNKNGYNKQLNFTDLILSNIGYIVGAGIFILLGKTIKISGNYAWLSVIISGLFIYFISNSYIDVHNKYLSNDAEYQAIKDKYGNIISNVSIILTIVANICIIYVVSLGFGSYSNVITNNLLNSKFASIIGLLLATFINVYGINLTANINNFITITGIIGLLILIALGFIYIIKHDMLSSLSSLITPLKNIKFKNIINILAGAFIFIFAYFGFELIIRLNAESVNNETDIPEAMHYSIWFSILIYTLITIVFISVINHDGNINSSKLNKNVAIRPLSLLINTLTTNQILIKYIEMCGIGLTWNTILLSITYGSRLLTEFAKKHTNIMQNNYIGDFINTFSEINNTTKTPINSILIISICVTLLILLDLPILIGTIIANGGLIIIMLLVYFSS